MEKINTENILYSQYYTINNQPWSEYHTDCEAKVLVLYDEGFLHLKFFVKEKQIRARYRETNGTVHKDNCVEFFVRFDNDTNYYNLEFNVLGNTKVAYGNGRHGREELPLKLIEQIEREVSMLPKSVNGQLYIEWVLDIKIPDFIFINNKQKELSQYEIFANFYKCGDDLDNPHYLCWNTINTENPDFHRPEFFKKLTFNK
ncbi:carbohydrate-binding family 9-like protein [Pseudopedobacter beijingensis]|uniref:Carbohydrate-binding family 9-like protein n=1 Tax=Pseudopedobacter beijingensis TaxID=1207056 RepID=A0ABW4IH30_9SPHI